MNCLRSDEGTLDLKGAEETTSEFEPESDMERDMGEGEEEANPALSSELQLCSE